MTVTILIGAGDTRIGDECPRCGGKLAEGDTVTPLSNCVVHADCHPLAAYDRLSRDPDVMLALEPARIVARHLT